MPLFGHERLLCPSSLQMPQQRLRFVGGGRSVPETSSGAGVPCLLDPDGRGTAGNGQVASLSLSGQNGRMLS